MKLSGRKAQDFLANPDPDMAAVLLYGPDRGLVRERTQFLLAATVEDPADPFVVTELPGDSIKSDPARLADEVATLSLTGERRVVVVKDGDQGLADTAAHVLVGMTPETTLLLVEAGDLGPRDRLRRAFEAAKNAVALPCYLDGSADLESLIRTTLKDCALDIDPAALAYLLGNLGSDRLVSRSELEKLALYKVGDGTLVSLEDVEACVGDGAPLVVDDAVQASASGDQRHLDRALGRCFQAGENAVTVLRAVTRHIQRLHFAAALVAQGQTAEQALKRLRPPVFFKQQQVFRGQLGHWGPERLGKALEILLEAEIQCKSTGMPAEVICHRALMRIAQAAHSAPRRR